MSGLTPATFERGGLEAALSRLQATFNGASAGPQVRLDLELGRPLAQEVEVAVYRVIAEGVTNAVRHASARDVVVHLRACADRVTVEITDDGTGGPVHPGVGLTSLTNRAAALGGTLDVAAAPAGGVLLRLVLPTEPEEL